jgi:hypothetical protein
MSEYSWLDEEPSVDSSWLDEPAPAEPEKNSAKSVVPASQADPKRAEMVLATANLPFEQRVMLKCMVMENLHQASAIRKFNDYRKKNGRKPLDRSDGYRMMRGAHFQKVLKMYTQAMLESVGLDDPAATLVRINAVVDDALTPVPMISNGQAVILPSGETMMEVDRGSALKGLEMIGKTQGIFRKDEENQQRVTVVLDFSGEKPAGEAESEIIDGEFSEVDRG